MRAIIFPALLFPAAALAGGDGLLPHDDPAAVARGQALYAEHCAACHGADLEGEPNWRMRNADGLLPAPPHDESGHTWHHPDEQLIDLTANGVSAVLARRGLEYDSAMPGFAEVLSEDEILEVLGFIKSTWPPHIVELHDQINADR